MRAPWNRSSLFETRRRHTYGLGKWTRVALALAILAAIGWLARDRFNFFRTVYEGRRAIGNRDYRSARDALQRAWHLRPDHPLIYDCAGFLFLNEQAPGWKAKVRENYENARGRRLRWNAFINHVKEARRMLDSGQYEQAELELEHVLALSPRNADANLLQGHLMYSQGKLARAIDQYQKALALSPSSSEIQSMLARAQEAKSKGSIPYILDRHGQVLAAYDASTGNPVYPCDFWTAHIVGYRSEKHGNSGLEEALAARLRGNVVTLTIDAAIQRIADAVLGWQKGAVVVLAPQTGEILACVSHPAFRPSLIDRNWTTYRDNPNNPLKNRALESLYEPGSIAKIITAAAAIESHTDMSRVFPLKCRGYVMINNETFWCWKRHNAINSFSDGFNNSCNIAIARIAPLIGAASLTQYLRTFGFGENDQIVLDLPVARSTAPMDLMNQTKLISTAIGIGKGFRITPLHASMLAATIANGGVMMAPILIREMHSVTGSVISSSSPHVYKIAAKKDTAAALTRHMIEFVQSGIGRKARMIRYHVAGKTGTSGSSKRGLDGWFICFAPADKPELAVAILCENGGTGHAVAAPLAQRLLSETLR